jgi:hypothetical protein
MSIRHAEWYSLVKDVIFQEYDDVEERLAALTLLEYTSDIREGLEPMASQARAWFATRNRGGLPLEAVCGILYMNPMDVRHRLEKLMLDDEQIKRREEEKNNGNL